MWSRCLSKSMEPSQDGVDEIKKRLILMGHASPVDLCNLVDGVVINFVYDLPSVC